MAKRQTRRSISINRETYERLRLAGMTLDCTLAAYTEKVLIAAMDEAAIAPSPYVRPGGANPVHQQRSRLRREMRRRQRRAS